MSEESIITTPPSFAIKDNDLIYVITGYNQDNSYLLSKETSIYNLKKFIIGTSNTIGLNNINTEQAPNTGVFVFNTGLNAVLGNNIEIQFTNGTPAANKYGGVGGKYYSGIISTTGLNARSENLIVHDFESSWPYSGIIYNTGLNARAGNCIDITYRTDSSGSLIYGGAGPKYYSGIISTTGINATPGRGIYFTESYTWPNSNEISSLEKFYESFSMSNNIFPDEYDDNFSVPIDMPIKNSSQVGIINNSIENASAIKVKILDKYDYPNSKIKIEGFYRYFRAINVFPPLSTLTNNAYYNDQEYIPTRAMFITSIDPGWVTIGLESHGYAAQSFVDYCESFPFTISFSGQDIDLFSSSIQYFEIDKMRRILGFLPSPRYIYDETYLSVHILDYRSSLCTISFNPYNDPQFIGPPPPSWNTYNTSISSTISGVWSYGHRFIETKPVYNELE